MVCLDHLEIIKYLYKNLKENIAVVLWREAIGSYWHITERSRQFTIAHYLYFSVRGRNKQEVL